MNSVTFFENQLKTQLAINNPLRRLIIDLLKSHRSLSSSDLAQILHISVTRCVYHLENLKDLVSQDNQNRYFLSDEGKKAYQLLHLNI